ncbi:MAG TPA: hypothetical protein VFA53_11890 [Xanthobacteraceae bacterium]|nr:hypothetical protein [Xanthobacteraceae bacterium]
MRLKERFDVFCAMLGMWAYPILDYFEDVEEAGLADFSELMELLEAGEFPEVLAAPLLLLGVAGSGRLLWSSYRSLPRRRRHA